MNYTKPASIYALGNPTKLAPIPKPAPLRAETPMLGTYVSKILKVAAAVKAIKATSSKLRERLGIAKAANATIKPSTRYLIARLRSSPRLKPSILNIYRYYTEKNIYMRLKLKNEMLITFNND
jgi:hypothetical protein